MPKSGLFIPAHYLLGGMGWEETSVNNNEASKKWLEDERLRTKDDVEIHSKVVQEYPMNIPETFQKQGTNIFNQQKIALQYNKLNYELKDAQPERGFLEWIKSDTGKITGVKWSKNIEGDIEIVEHPVKGENNSSYRKLYVAGVDRLIQSTHK